MSPRSSLLLSFIDRYVSLATTIFSSILIARLLTPAEIGAFSVAMVLLLYVNAVRDLGAGQYIVQMRELTPAGLRSVWAVQLGLGLFLASLVALASYPVSQFYREPKMRDILLVVALNYALTPFGSLTYAYLMREMRFQALAAMRSGAALVGAIVTIGLAYIGWGSMSLAVGSLASSVATAALGMFFRPEVLPWKPGLGEVKSVFKFGSRLTLTSVLSTFSNSMPELLLGRLQSLIAAAMYSRANGLVSLYLRLFFDPVSTVCLPWFATQQREQGGFGPAFVKSVSYLSAVGWSFCLALIFLAQPMIRLLYGWQWDEAVPIARLLAIASLFSVPAVLCQTALVASGAAGKLARLVVLNTAITVGCLAVGAHYSLIGAATGMLVATALNSMLNLQRTCVWIGVSLRDLGPALARSGMVAACSAALPAACLWYYGPNPVDRGAPLVLGGLGSAAGFLAGVVLARHPIAEELAHLRLKLMSRFSRS